MLMAELRSLLMAVIATFIALIFATGISYAICFQAVGNRQRIMIFLSDVLRGLPVWIVGLCMGSILFHSYTSNRQANMDELFFLAGILLLIVLLIPLLISILCEGYFQISNLTREAGLGLGLSEWELARHVYFPLLRPIFYSALLIGIGRAFCETVALWVLFFAHFPSTWFMDVNAGVRIVADALFSHGKLSSLMRTAGLPLLSFFIIIALTQSLSHWLIRRSLLMKLIERKQI
ncbi:hypothetical protein ACOJUR_13950 [Alicyclobacillus tolerans]|uniref:hypothetical protein n=1 Tax=Alicyclobacillus tolerans TaxID=90970 RepID=UPI003B802581